MCGTPPLRRGGGAYNISCHTLPHSHTPYFSAVFAIFGKQRQKNTAHKWSTIGPKVVKNGQNLCVCVTRALVDKFLESLVEKANCGPFVSRIFLPLFAEYCENSRKIRCVAVRQCVARFSIGPSPAAGGVPHIATRYYTAACYHCKGKFWLGLRKKQTLGRSLAAVHWLWLWRGAAPQDSVLYPPR